MKSEYQDIIKTVCNFDNWKTLPLEEKQGAYGVAIALAFLKGVNPKLEDMSKHLKLKREEIDKPFKRLLMNGLFSQSYNAKEDKVLTGHCEGNQWQNSTERSRNAWAIIAGIASGYVGLKEDT